MCHVFCSRGKKEFVEFPVPAPVTLLCLSMAQYEIMEPCQIHINGQYIIYDAGRLQPPQNGLFDPAALQRCGCWIGSPAGGRGSAGYIVIDGIPAVLRRYRRGGMLASALGERYVWLGLARSRPWREWRMLAKLHTEGLPVPAPLAARVKPSGIFYRADIVLERIDSCTLAEYLGKDRLPLEQWYAIGLAVGRLHRRGVDHADLNAHNILIRPHGDSSVYVIDFDRARLRSPQQRWQRRNLVRLQRSLRKLAAQVPGFAGADDEALAQLRRGWSAAAQGE